MLLLWFFINYISSALGATCGHSTVLKNSHLVSSQAYHEHPFELNETRRLEKTSAYRGLRIKYYFDHENIHLSESQREMLITRLLPEAAKLWKSYLSVIPVEGNLFAQRFCTGIYQTSPPTCAQVYKDQTCLHVRIPDEHFAPIRECKTCPSANQCQGGDCTEYDGSGVADTDYLLYVQAHDTAYCGPNVLAYAAACQRDQHDRPIFGNVNFCPSSISTSENDYQQQLSTAMHEISHALGFSSDLYAYMRDENGDPRTPRNIYGEPYRLDSQTCPNGVTVDNFARPSMDTVQFFTERGHSVAKMVTPNVLAYVRQHFGCDTLNGAELENHEQDVCIGSHWEERIFQPEFMSPVLSNTHNVVSGLTLAFFEDSGWYHADQSLGELLHWGAKRGCDFAIESCFTTATATTPATTKNPDHFCLKSYEHGCTVNGRSKATCSYRQRYTSIPEPYRYFPDNSGGTEYGDYCPYFQGYEDGQCSDISNMYIPPGTQFNIMGETFGESSRCTRSTLHSHESKDWRVLAGGAGCYHVSCHSPGVAVLTIPTSTSSIQVNCTQKGEEKTVQGYSGTLTCPDPSLVCQRTECDAPCPENSSCVLGECKCQPGFHLDNTTQTCQSPCPNACSQRGKCNTTTHTCDCKTEYTGDDCSKSSGKLFLQLSSNAPPFASNSYQLLLTAFCVLLITY